VPQFEVSLEFALVVERGPPIATVELPVQTGGEMTSRRVIKNFGSPEIRQRVFSSVSLRELSHRPTLIEVHGQRWEGDAWRGVARA
jgi:hypothetical protein